MCSYVYFFTYIHTYVRMYTFYILNPLHTHKYIHASNINRNIVMWFYIDYHTCIYDPVLSTVGTQSNDILVAVSTTRAHILTSKYPSPVNSTETLWRSDLSLRKKMQCTFSYFLSVLFILFLVSIFLVNLLYVGVGDHCLIFPYPFPFFQLPPELPNMPFSGKEQKNRTSTKVVFGNIPCLTSCHSQRQGVDLIFIESLGGGEPSLEAKQNSTWVFTGHL